MNYSAASGDASIIEAFTRGSNVVIRGVSPGQTTVTATATNEAEKSASVEFQVLSVNLPPIFTDSVTEDAVGVGRIGFWRLYSLFVEPGEEEMTFEATSDFPGLAVALTDSLVYFTGTSAGRAQVTLTATDPHGDEASGTITVTIWEPVVVVDEDFEDEAALDDWRECGTADDEDITNLWIDDGSLFVEGLSSQFIGSACTLVDGADIEIRSSLRPEQTGYSGFQWVTNGDGGDRFYRIFFGAFTENRNWIVTADTLLIAGDNSASVRLGSSQEYRVVFSKTIMYVSVDGNVVFTEALQTNTNSNMTEFWLVATSSVGEFEDVTVTARPGQRRPS